MQSEQNNHKQSTFRPKYEELCDLLRKKIQKQPSGTRLPSFRSLMKRHNLSVQTVKMAIRKLEAENLIVAKRGSGLYVSDQRTTKLVYYHRSLHPSYTEDAREKSLLRAIKDAHWYMEVFRHDEISDEDIGMSPQPQACAHIVSQDMVNLRLNLITQLKNQNVPILVIGRETNIAPLDYVTANDHQILSLLVKHLRALGHRNIAYLVNEPSSFQEIERRKTIFQEILEMADMPEGVIIDCATAPGHSSTVMAYHGLKNYLEVHSSPLPFTAIIVSSAAGAPGTLRALHEKGIGVPKDCSVASFGADPTNSFLIPSVTDAGILISDYGEYVVKVLQRRFDGDESPCIGMKIPAKLAERESTSPSS
ncbi:MAG: substrate-binding domain-containing protein [Verrucomicrobiota bacterium JB024]|nr:substrate-binding domain-containing protein [Verrucomicrobiota bacterium JB024]